MPIPESFPNPPNAVSAEKISEVSLRASTGLLGSGFVIVLRGDGTAELECAFYNLDRDDKPEIEYAERHCGELYRRRPEDFVRSETRPGDATLKAVFTGSLPKEKFAELARLVIKNDFLSMNERYTQHWRTDSPADTTAVTHAGKTKKVADSGDEGGENLAEIKRMIYTLADESQWTSKGEMRSEK